MICQLVDTNQQKSHFAPAKTISENLGVELNVNDCCMSVASASLDVLVFEDLRVSKIGVHSL